VSPTFEGLLIPRAWEAEYLAIRALSLACVGESSAAAKLGEEAREMSADCFSRMCVLSALAAAAVPTDRCSAAIAELLSVGSETDLLDPVLLAVRASEPLLAAMIAHPEGATMVVELATRSGDNALSRRVGVRTRATRSPGELLTPRELEVLGLIAQGHRNREIAAALFIAESTVKVHVRHILERLGVRSRAEAVARYERLRRL
jgi:DNA-binding NarL/FixJ family response regulator